MRKTLPVLVGLAGALMVSATAEAALTGIKATVKQSLNNPRLFICNLYATFSAVGDQVVAIVGLPAPGAQLVYSTNSVPGFHQETLPLGIQDQPLNRVLFGVGPNYSDDTYLTIGLKHGYQGADALQLVGLNIGWNAGGSLTSAAGPGGSYFLAGFPAQGVEVGGQVLIGQFVIDKNAATTDGLAPRIDVVIPQIAWADAAGVGSTTNNFSASHIVPAPGTLALLGLAGLAGIRRRRR